MLNEENMTFKEKLKGYKIKEKIGVGSYGKVYKVEKENIIYVLKQIPLNNATDIESIKNEATILSSLNSEYVVKYYESFIEDNNLNIIMEYCEGGDLSTYMKQYKAKILSNKSYNSFSSLILPENLIWKMFIQISLGLYHIHKKDKNFSFILLYHFIRLELIAFNGFIFLSIFNQCLSLNLIINSPLFCLFAKLAYYKFSHYKPSITLCNLKL